MEENRGNHYYDMDSLNNNNGKPDDNGSKGLFFTGIIVGLAGALLIVSVVYLVTRVQGLQNARNRVETQRDAAVTEGTVVTSELTDKIKLLEDD